MRLFFTCVSFVTAFLSQAQLFDNREGNAYGDFPKFNRAFIRTNSIRSIKGHYTYKRQGEIMKTTKYTYIYTFDSLGRLASTVENRQDDGTKDTVWTWYSYDDQDNLIEWRKGNHTSSSFTRNTYDLEGNKLSITKGQYYKNESGQTDQVLFDTETLVQSRTASQTTTRFMNSYKLPYKEEVVIYDSSGYLNEKSARYLMTSGNVTERFAYNDKGLVAQRSVIESGKEQPVERFEFHYDDNNQLTEQHIHRNGVYVTEIEFLYNEKTQLLTYIITRDVATNSLIILNISDISRF
jgi:hypothetical protein